MAFRKIDRQANPMTSTPIHRKVYCINISHPLQLCAPWRNLPFDIGNQQRVPNKRCFFVTLLEAHVLVADDGGEHGVKYGDPVGDQEGTVCVPNKCDQQIHVLVSKAVVSLRQTAENQKQNVSRRYKWVGIP